MTDTLLQQVIELANERGEIDSGPNVRALLEEAEAQGLVSRIPDRIAMRPPKKPSAVKILGQTVPIIGGMYDVYRLAGEAATRASAEEPNPPVHQSPEGAGR